MDYRIIEGAENLKLEDVVRLLRTTYWAEKRPAETIEKAMQHSACFGIRMEGSDRLGAFAREKQLKGWRRARKNELIESVNPTWQDLAGDWFA